MSDSLRLLERIEEGIVHHGGDLGGWTRRCDDALQIFDGRVTLRAEIQDAGPSATDGVVHAHVMATLHEYDDEFLDACLFGIGDDREGAIGQAAVVWLTGVAGPIRSFLDDRPICMTCRAGVKGGVITQGYAEGDYGLPGLRAYVGPVIARGIQDEMIGSDNGETKPWFRFAAESAAPRRVHLAKASVVSMGKDGWRRELEIDGHDVAHLDPDWPADVRGPDAGYMTRYAVFEFPRDSPEIPRRVELERTIRHFAENFARHESVDRLMEEMVSQGFDPDFVHDSESLATMAFGRVCFEAHGVRYSPYIIRACRDGTVQTDVPLMSLPAYCRARSLTVQLRESMPGKDFQAVCLYHAESNLILKAFEAAGDGNPDLSKMKLFPCVVPERGASNRTMDAALGILQEMVGRIRPASRKPWWKFW